MGKKLSGVKSEYIIRYNNTYTMKLHGQKITKMVTERVGAEATYALVEVGPEEEENEKDLRRLAAIMQSDTAVYSLTVFQF